MSFATAQGVKELDGSTVGTSKDNSLKAVVAGVNAKTEEYLSRHLLVGDHTDVFDVYPTRPLTFVLKGYPVNSIASVRVDDEELSTDYYRFNRNTGRLELLIPTPLGVAVLEVDYNGGMAQDVAELRENFPSIVYQANLQALFEFKRKDSISHSETSQHQGGSETLIAFKLQPEYKRVLRRYRRKQYIG